VANDDLDNLDRLNQILAEDGYLFFRGVLDPDEVGRVREDFIRVLQAQGFVAPGEASPTWTGRAFDLLDDDPLYALTSYDELANSPRTISVLERIFGEPVFVNRNATLRYAFPEDAAHVTPAHQDHFFIRETDRFRTLWVPVMDIDQAVGGLAVAPGSQNRGLQPHEVNESVYSYVLKGRKQRGIPLERVAPPWLTADYHPEDLLVFHSHTIHWALPNRSNVIRLSFDTRCQPASIPRTWQSQTTILEQREYRRTAQRVATEEGASEPLFEEMIIEMMRRGAPVDRGIIKMLMKELGPSAVTGR
jgi:hypothetical protein